MQPHRYRETSKRWPTRDDPEVVVAFPPKLRQNRIYGRERPSVRLRDNLRFHARIAVRILERLISVLQS